MFSGEKNNSASSKSLKYCFYLLLDFYETVAAFKSKTDKNKLLQISSRLQNNFQAGAPGM